ncbi:MAG: Clp protease N-terminal domain-containing protein [Candidatus Tectimicrobiota bacterium]
MPNLSQGAYLAWELAAREAARARHQYIDREFLLIGLCSLEKWLAARSSSEDHGVACDSALETQVEAITQVLRVCALTPARLRQTLRAALGKGTWHPANRQVVHRSNACKATFQRALSLADSSGAPEASCLHVLLALLEQPGGLILGIITALKVDIDALRSAVAVAVAHQSGLPPLPDGAPRAVAPQAVASPVPACPPTTETPYLDHYGHDMTLEARAGKLEPVVGRKNEILALVRALGQRSKNIPVLISEPGVSRIAVVKGLALRIARGDVVETIRDKRLVELHMGALSGVTTLHGELEQALQQVLDEASRHSHIVLFIDDLHAVLGAGTPAAGLEGATRLKAALVRGTLRCIGATSIESYQRYIETDPQLERLCQPILVNEPSLAEMQEILAQVRGRYEQHHQVTITTEALEAAVALAAKYLPEKRFPEKALDIIDQACSRARIVQLTQLLPDDNAALEREVTRLTVAEVLADKTGIPVAHLLESERDKLRRRIEELKTHVASS